MVTIVQVGNPLGIVFGFGICTLLSSNWKASFAIEAGVLCLLGIIILIFPKKYFTNTLAIFEENEDLQKSQKQMIKKLLIFLKMPIIMIMSVKQLQPLRSQLL